MSDAYFLPMDGIPEGLLANHTRLELAIGVDRLVEELGTISPRQRTVVEFKFYLGMTDEEASEALSIPLHTLQREWYRARRWLFEQLGSGKWKAAGTETSGS